ncbi:MAG TPA: DUF3566 domain-containing protein [Euzebyales bacterium]|nr:DUF3566 domain-containing protein [Euzebyales bacterium]
MEDWLPSERSAPTISRSRSSSGAGRSGGRTGSRPAVATEDRTTDSRARFTEAFTSRMNARPRPAGSRPTHRLVRRDLMVRRVDPWSVLKISLVFYSCMLIIVMLANAVLWAFITRLGLIEQVTEIAGALNIALTINTGNILQATFLLGVLGVIFWSSVNVFFAFLYNLVADLIGGVHIDLAEDE